MARESSRKCSHCGLNGHNSRTCSNLAKENHRGNNNYCVKLFGVNLMENRDESMRKSFSMGNLIHACGNVVDLNNNAATVAVAAVNNVLGVGGDHSGAGDDGGYLSDGFLHNKKRKAAHERKKGKPWSEEEHRTFLAGLKKLGKGDWRGISKKFVISRTPTQVASHAQKYFLRKLNANDKKKRRASLFDISPEIKGNNHAPRDPPTSSLLTRTSTRETSQVLLPKNSSENQPQVNNNLPTQLINRFPHLCLDTPQFVPPANGSAAAASGVANLHSIPYVVGVSSSDNVPMIPLVKNLGRRRRRSPRSPQRTTGAAAAAAAHPSGIPPSPRTRSSPDRTAALMKKLPSSSSSSSSAIAFETEDDHGLDLKIGLPQSPQPKNMSSQQTSVGAIIRVT